MSMMDLIPVSLRALPRDAAILFFTRFTRLFAYGALSVVLVFYLVSLGLTEAQVGLLLTLTLAGDIAISLLLTTRADQMGRSEEHTSELQSRLHLVCRLLLEKKKNHVKTML